jgi:type II secretory pathway component PulF
MAEFKYSALTHDGSERRGKADGASEAAVLARLKAEGLYVSDIEAVARYEDGDGVLAMDPMMLFALVSRKRIALFLRHLGVMMKSGVGLVQALEALKRQSRSGGLRRMIGRILADVEQGRDLSEAMRKTGKFSLYDIAMIKAAEASGELDTMLDAVAD